MMIYMMCAVVALSGSPKDTPDDPAFKDLAKMVGGHWEGSLGKMKVKFTYHLLEAGKMVEGVGGLTQDGKPIMNMDSKFGWDAVAKQTYYLDCHGHDTVYSGHITKKDGKLVLDFTGLIGDKGHWVTYMKFPTKDDYEFNMFEFKGGKLEPTHLDVKLHRVW